MMRSPRIIETPVESSPAEATPIKLVAGMPSRDTLRRSLLEIAQAGYSARSLAEVYPKIHSLVSQLTGGEHCSVLLRDAITGIPRVEYWGDGQCPPPDRDAAMRGFAGHVLMTGSPLAADDVSRKNQAANLGLTEATVENWSCWMGAPLTASARMIGVLSVHSYTPGRAFTERDLEVLSTIAAQVSAVIERKRSEQALRESESRYRMLFDHAPDGIIICDPTGATLDANANLSRMLGHSREEFLNLKPEQVVADSEIEHIKPALEEIAGSSKHQREWLFRHKDGSVIPMEVSASKMPDDRILAIVRDLNERKRSEMALRISEERYRDLVENAMDIIYVHDLDGNYTSVNRAAERITGYSRAEIMALNMAQTIAPEYIDLAREMMAAKLAGNEITAYELEIIAKDGRRVTLEVNTRLMSVNGKPVGIQGIARDITERKLLEEKYRQSQKMEAIGLLAGGISHDFNNLLTAISGYSELTLAKMPESDPLRKNIEEIRDIGERASALTKQLLAFSRKQILQPVVHDLNSVVLQLDNMLRRLLRENIDLELDLEDGLPNIEADPTQLQQVVVNLTINAQDAMPAGGRLTISTRSVEAADMPVNGSHERTVGRYIRLSVIDTGEGIDDHIVSRIFEPFFTTKDPGRGSGLGLSTVHGIVVQSGGEIFVTSSKGRGTRFDVYLPAVSARVLVMEDARPPVSPSGKNETVLLVEDDRSVRQLVREVLTDKGYNVIETSSGESALEICSQNSRPIHLLLTDLVMPKINGIELSRQATELHPELKTIVMSGYATEALGQGSYKLPSGAFLQKPFTPDTLARKLREVLDAEPVGS